MTCMTYSRSPVSSVSLRERSREGGEKYKIRLYLMYKGDNTLHNHKIVGIEWAANLISEKLPSSPRKKYKNSRTLVRVMQGRVGERLKSLPRGRATGKAIKRKRFKDGRRLWKNIHSVNINRVNRSQTLSAHTLRLFIDIFANSVFFFERFRTNSARLRFIANRGVDSP